MTRRPGRTDERPVLRSLVGEDEAFLADVFGRRPSAARSDRLDQVFGVDDLDALISSGIRTPAIRLVRDGRRLAPAAFCSPTRIGSTTLSDTADPRRVLDEYRRGATVVVQSLQRTWPRLIDWCCALEAELGWPVQANAYLTPPSERGLDRHADGHDVFVVQLHGRKRWQVDGLDDRWVEAGDVLYIPSGTEHAAATDAEPSLHLTVGVHRPSIERIERSAFELARSRVLERSGAPDQDDEDDDHDGDNFERLADELRRVSRTDAVDRLRRSPRSSPVGGLADSVRRTLTADSTIRPVEGWTIEPDTTGWVRLTWGHGRLRFPAQCGEALAKLATGSTYRVDDLEGLEPSERMVLARRLLDERAATLTD